MAAKYEWTTLSEKVLLDRPPYVRGTQERVRTDSGVEIDDYYRVLLPEFAVCVLGGRSIRVHANGDRVER